MDPGLDLFLVNGTFKAKARKLCTQYEALLRKTLTHTGIVLNPKAFYMTPQEKEKETAGDDGAYSSRSGDAVHESHPHQDALQRFGRPQPVLRSPPIRVLPALDGMWRIALRGAV